jgi:hypothetical protein
MKGSQIAIIVGAVGIVAIVSVLLVSYETSSVIEVEDVFDKEIKPIEIPEIQEKLDEIEKIANETSYKPLPRDWQTSGPFQIDRTEYAIGENVFIRIGGLDIYEKGQIAVMRPLNSTHYSVYITIPFDGISKAAANTYFTPQISKVVGICSIDDLTGEWSLVFRGTNYTNLNFEITERIIPGTNTETVC